MLCVFVFRCLHCRRQKPAPRPLQCHQHLPILVPDRRSLRQPVSVMYRRWALVVALWMADPTWQRVSCLQLTSLQEQWWLLLLLYKVSVLSVIGLHLSLFSEHLSKCDNHFGMSCRLSQCIVVICLNGCSCFQCGGCDEGQMLCIKYGPDQLDLENLFAWLSVVTVFLALVLSPCQLWWLPVFGRLFEHPANLK